MHSLPRPCSDQPSCLEPWLRSRFGSGCYDRHPVGGDAAFFQEVAEMTGCGGFGNLGYGLILDGADFALKAALAVIE